MVTITSQSQDFINIDVKRLHGILLDFHDLSKQALDKINQLLDHKQYHISIEDLKQLLAYELSRLNLSDY